MIENINLSIPKEPDEVKNWMADIERRSFKGPGVDWERLIIWYGNQLPKYLWKEWKGELKPLGFTWQKFLKILRYRTDKILLWYRRIISWNELINEIIDLIKGPIGQSLTKDYAKK